jgi:hypothetical protein
VSKRQKDRNIAVKVREILKSKRFERSRCNNFCKIDATKRLPTVRMGVVSKHGDD